jgi:phosphatidylinositol 4-kinase B
VLNDAMSLDGLKKTPGFTTLHNYFHRTYDSSEESLATAKRNFACSLAAYSLFSHILLIKDRHNGK